MTSKAREPHEEQPLRDRLSDLGHVLSIPEHRDRRFLPMVITDSGIPIRYSGILIARYRRAVLTHEILAFAAPAPSRDWPVHASRTLTDRTEDPLSTWEPPLRQSARNKRRASQASAVPATCTVTALAWPSWARRKANAATKRGRSPGGRANRIRPWGHVLSWGRCWCVSISTGSTRRLAR
jgi:hypothetical protein